MHKSYQSTLPSSNRLLKKKWDDKYYSEHRILVRDARPSIDTRPPRTYMHLHMKLKKLQLEEERAATIERDNRILLEKMSTIMRTTGRIDNRNDYQGKSLNHEKRRRELLRVARENSTMIKRINERKPDTKQEDWEKNWSQNAAYLDNIAKYELGWHTSKSAKPRTADHSMSRSMDRSSEPPANHSRGHPSDPPTDRPREQSAEKPTARSEEKPASRAEEKPASRAEEKPAAPVAAAAAPSPQRSAGKSTSHSRERSAEKPASRSRGLIEKVTDRTKGGASALSTGSSVEAAADVTDRAKGGASASSTGSSIAAATSDKKGLKAMVNTKVNIK